MGEQGRWVGTGAGPRGEDTGGAGSRLGKSVRVDLPVLVRKGTFKDRRCPRGGVLGVAHHARRDLLLGN